MNYETFKGYREAFSFDEIKVVGKDVCLDGTWVHFAGMGRKGQQAFFYFLEQQPAPEEGAAWRPERTNRESMLESVQEDAGSAIHICRVKVGDAEFEMQGGSCGNLAQGNQMEANCFYWQMLEAGWRICKDSPFYSLDWNCTGLAVLELQGSYEKLPELAGPMEFTIGPACRRHMLQILVELKRGETNELHFLLEDGEEVSCYVNQVDLTEPLKEERKRFNDSKYQEKMLQHCTQEEFEEMKQMVLGTLQSDCPEGMGYFTVEYECTRENFSLQFYAAADLDSAPEEKEGCASMLMFGGKPEQETGPHGLRNRIAVIQYAVPVETQTLRAELFMALETIGERRCVLKG